MSREDQIRSFGDEECETGRQFERSAPKRPSSKSTCHARNRIVVHRVGRTAAAQQPGQTTSTAPDSPTAHATGEPGQWVARIALA